jgi:hypothetical protein
MRHDYELPPEWNAMSDEEKSQWMTQERCRRQALRQQTPTSRRAVHKMERLQRVLDARNETTEVER